MKKTLLFAVAGSAFVLTLVVGCSKKNDSTSTDMKNLVGTYKISAWTASGAGRNINVLDQLDACQKDDNYKLNSDSTYQYIDAGTTCGSGNSFEGTWYSSNNYIILDGDSVTIKSFNGTTLVLTETEDVGGGISAVNTLTLTKL